jgi:hypothetical protein
VREKEIRKLRECLGFIHVFTVTGVLKMRTEPESVNWSLILERF